MANDTAMLQALLNPGGLVVVPPGTYNVSQLAPVSGSTIVLNGVTINELPGFPNTFTFFLSNVHDVTIIGGTLNGSAGDRTYGFAVMFGSSNITIRRTYIHNMNGLDGNRGDGVYINQATNVTLDQVTSRANYRQGASIINADTVTIIGCAFTDMTSNAPGAGIDMEPNSNLESIDDVTISGCRFERNEFGITHSGNFGNASNIAINHCLSVDTRSHGIVCNPRQPTGFYTVNDVVISGSGGYGVAVGCSGMTLARATVVGAENAGIRVIGGATGWTVADCTVTDGGYYGVFCSGIAAGTGLIDGCTVLDNVQTSEILVGYVAGSLITITDSTIGLTAPNGVTNYAVNVQGTNNNPVGVALSGNTYPNVAPVLYN